MPAWLQAFMQQAQGGGGGLQALLNQNQNPMQPVLQQQDPQQAAFAELIRQQVMQLIQGSRQPINADELTNTPEARAFARVHERALQRFRAQQAESRGRAGQGAEPGTGGMIGGGLGSDIASGEQELGERINAFESNLVANEMRAKRQQLVQALSLGAGMLTADQENQLRRELATLDNNLRMTLGRADIGLRGYLGGGELSLGLLRSLMQNQQFSDQLQYLIASQQAGLNQHSMQGLF